MTRYTARVKKVGRFWEIHVPELDRTTQVVRLDEVETTVRDLANLVTDEPVDNIMVNREFVLAPAIRRRIDAARVSRDQAQSLSMKAAADMSEAARELRRAGYTVRDVGAVLDVSYQRAQQIAARPETIAHRQLSAPRPSKVS